MFQKNNATLFLLGACLITWVMPLSAGLAQEEEDYKILNEIIQNEFKQEAPTEQGTDLNGVIKRFKTTDKKAAIVLEACLDEGADLDDALFDKLKEKQVPAALFLDQGWLEKNSTNLKKMMVSGSLSIQSHGLFCRPLSVNGKGVPNHPGTAGVEEVFEEVEKNARDIEKFSGKLPRFFKAGYGFYDDVALKIVTVLGYAAVEGDMRLRSKDVESEAALQLFFQKLQPGSIISIPANRPGTASVWLPKILNGLTQRGYQVVALDDVINTDEDSH